MAKRPNKKKASEEDVIAMRYLWEGKAPDAETVQEGDPTIFHNPHRQTQCSCRMTRLSHEVKYCVVCWPIYPTPPVDEPWQAVTDRVAAKRPPMPEVDARIAAFLNKPEGAIIDFED